jgi:hypothetical protein
MRAHAAIYLAAAIGGLLSGPFSLQATSASQPPHVWEDIPFVFLGCAAGLFMVIGFQVLLRNFRAARFAALAFGAIAVYFLAAGAAAAAWGLVQFGPVPHAFVFLASGLGSVAGVALCHLLFASKWSAI